MKKLYMRLALTFLLLLAASSSLASLLAYFISRHLLTEAIAQNPLLLFELRGLLVPLLTLLSFSCAVSWASKKATAPIVALSTATHQIAKGNFDIQVAESRRKDEVGDLERNFNLMARELKGNEFMRKDFIANVSHEIKTPLAIIQGYGKLLADDSLSAEEHRQYAQMIENESQRLITLTTNILRLSKLDNQAILSAAGHFQLDEQIRQAVLMLQPKWSARNIDFDIELLPCDFMGDEELMSQVWINLIDNAIKFSHDNGIVAIKMQISGNTAYFSIADNGIGMSPLTRTRIFDQFFQGDTSLSKEGSGLGLAIVKRIVEMHGGGVEVVSLPKKGSRFIISLPLDAQL